MKFADLLRRRERCPRRRRWMGRAWPDSWPATLKLATIGVFATHTGALAARVSPFGVVEAHLRAAAPIKRADLWNQLFQQPADKVRQRLP